MFWSYLRVCKKSFYESNYKRSSWQSKNAVATEYTRILMLPFRKTIVLGRRETLEKQQGYGYLKLIQIITEETKRKVTKVSFLLASRKLTFSLCWKTKNRFPKRVNVKLLSCKNVNNVVFFLDFNIDHFFWDKKAFFLSKKLFAN